MKNYNNILLVIAMIIGSYAFAKAESRPTENIEITAEIWTGTWNTKFGQVILNQKGKFVVGTYEGLGTIRSLAVLGNELYAEFDNNGRVGYFKWTKSGNSFTGKWGWTSSYEQGSWDGSKTTNASQNYIKGNWSSTYGELEFIHSKNGVMAAHYGNQGGMIWGEINDTIKTFTGKYRNKQGAKTKTCSFIFKNTSFTGKFNDRAYGSWNGNRPQTPSNTSSASQSTASSGQSELKISRLKLTLNSLNMYMKPRMTRLKSSFYSFAAKIEIDGRVWSARDKHYRSYSLFSGDISSEIIKPNTFLIFEIPGTMEALSANHSFKVFPEYKYSTLTSSYIKTDKSTARQINLEEVMKYLKGITNASDYPIVSGHDGRRNLSNSADTFWLESLGGKRIIRGYGDIRHFDGDFGFGYHYTIELVD